MDTQLVMEWKGLIIQGRMTYLWRKMVAQRWAGRNKLFGLAYVACGTPSQNPPTSPS